VSVSPVAAAESMIDRVRLALSTAVVAGLVSSSCSRDTVDEQAWRDALAASDVEYASSARWQSVRDAWLQACVADDILPLADRAQLQLEVLEQTWDQVRINIEHACPDRLEELHEALRSRPVTRSD